MGYSLNHVDGLGLPFEVIHGQIVEIPAQGYQPVANSVRKILFVLSGECRHQIVGWDGAWSHVHLHPGDIFALPNRCEQRYLPADRESRHGSRLHVIRLSFDPELLPALPLGSRRESVGTPVGGDALAWAAACLSEIRYLRSGSDTLISETLSHLREEAERRSPGYRLRIHGLCVSLLVLFARRCVELPLSETHFPSGPRLEASHHIAKVKAYLRTSLHQPTPLAAVAAATGLSEEHMARLFKKSTGMTIGDYLRRLRVAEAKNLLAATGNNLSEIALQTGYSSLTVFSRNFTRETGLTPSEFRKQIARQIG